MAHLAFKGHHHTIEAFFMELLTAKARILGPKHPSTVRAFGAVACAWAGTARDGPSVDTEYAESGAIASSVSRLPVQLPLQLRGR